ncbi:hypothetical protein QAD02_015924 [Eretmocerus hayati]|uniref:Uncharacterized protein n=1 Tax=Eretmocerus hayati TaxID=131215 RepID=A0ACC2PA16_9HYME|nr:hypothetical protein QAD02_015924 [Eretmocerus hayati]
MDLTLLILIFIVISTILYWYLTKTYKHWENQNVPCLPNPVPGLGHMMPIITLKQSLQDFVLNAYGQTDASVIGFYFVRKPAIIVRDPELVKSVLVTNFNSFRNNSIQLNEKSDPVMAKNPFFATDPDTWKTSRTRTVQHLSGRKLGQLFIIVNEVVVKMHSYVIRKIDENNGSFEYETKDFFTKYTGEVVANAAFAIEGQSFHDNPDKWCFDNVAKTLFEPTLLNGMKQALLFYLPEVGHSLGVSFLQKSTDQYFRENLKATLKQRKEVKSPPHDFLQFCIDSNEKDDVDNIIADLIVFYGDVYETSSSSLSSVFYHLSKHQDIQEKLREHIANVMKKYGNQITYESLKEMNYLEQVIYEALRITPPFPSNLKVCTEEITLQGSDGLKIHLKPGNPVLVPIVALHGDEKHWPNAQDFDPDRFCQENQTDRNKFVFLPFGEGPRQCPGMRFAMMLMKLATASLIHKFSIAHSHKTKEPLEIEPSSIITYVKGGLWAKFEKLNQSG